MGVRTVAVFSEADRLAQHVLSADESMFIGPPAASESYLLGDRIMAAALSSGAKAIHPGYGFLSENAGFAKLCETNGVEFVGPPASSIVSMGSKSESKRIMEAAGVPCTPGYHGDDQDFETLTTQAAKVGFPVMLKAVLGGGGKGMRVVEDAAGLKDGIESCQREALSSFGDARILIEKYLRTPRHVELQVFADKHGNVVHLFERDCSVQRRHQKVLEESPAPGMPVALRKKMGDAAVAAAKAVGYVGAGTVEFMVDAPEGSINDDSPFYFMEMNTRLQVEHPVTEMVTGIDLVEWQIRIACGQMLPILKQEDIPLIGHALESRVYAESPGGGFLPGSGKIQYLREPKLPADEYQYPSTKYRQSLRVETGVVQGDTVTVFYDPMISKVVVHGPNRESALRQMEAALGNYRVVGVPTNIEFLVSCLRHPAFNRGGVDTSFIPKYQHELLGVAPTAKEDARAAALGVISNALVEMKDHKRTAEMPYGFRTTRPLQQHTEIDLFTDDGSEVRRVKVSSTCIPSVSPSMGDIAFDVNVSREGFDTIKVHVSASVNQRQAEDLSVVVDGQSVKVCPVTDDKTGDLFLFDATGTAGAGGVLGRLLYRLTTIAEDRVGGDVTGAGAAKSPMPGKIVKVMVVAGDVVEKGQPLVIMEAMKMEHVVKAGTAGVVSEVLCKVDDFVDDAKVLCKVE